ncbi:MAG: Mur ligase family protein [Armatimonadota bacterium]|nr:Mur ligase family protein [Armatimonadota bacterium]
MSYAEAQRYIESLQARGWRLGLDRMEVFLDRLGNPHVGLRAFHIAGTNGKGSVTGMIAKCLTASGKRTGAFLSPYVYDFRERIQIGGEMISKQDVARLTTLMKPVADEMVFEEVGGPTEFEFKTAMAFLFWKEQKCDVVSVEVGLGGRLDATNVIESPLCAVITEIGLDHQVHLGDTIEKIAFEKAGIIKPGRPVVTGVTDDRAFEVIRIVAEERGCECIRVLSPTPKPSRIGHSERGEPDYQRRNREVAIAALCAGMPDAAQGADEVLKSFSMPGRMEAISENPRLILDGAHNEQAIRAVLESIDGQIVCVYSCATGHAPLTDLLKARCRKVLSAPMAHARALPADEWETTHASVRDAIAAAFQAVREGETILVTGSFFLLAEAKRALRNLTSER